MKDIAHFFVRILQYVSEELIFGTLVHHCFSEDLESTPSGESDQDALLKNFFHVHMGSLTCSRKVCF